MRKVFTVFPVNLNDLKNLKFEKSSGNDFVGDFFSASARITQSWVDRLSDDSYLTLRNSVLVGQTFVLFLSCINLFCCSLVHFHSKNTEQKGKEFSQFFTRLFLSVSFLPKDFKHRSNDLIFIFVNKESIENRTTSERVERELNSSRLVVGYFLQKIINYFSSRTNRKKLVKMEVSSFDEFNSSSNCKFCKWFTISTAGFTIDGQ